MPRASDPPPLPWTRGGTHPELAVILPALRIGECARPEDAEWLRRVHGVSAVVSLQDDADLLHKGLRLAPLRDAFRAQGIAFHRLPIGDGDAVMLGARLDDALRLLHELLCAGESVFLHCNAGLNRAPTVAIAYLHVHCGHGLEEARDLVKVRRACVPYWSVLRRRYGGGGPPPRADADGPDPDG
jgi:protein-tyrosine phosphatase